MKTDAHKISPTFALGKILAIIGALAFFACNSLTAQSAEEFFMLGGGAFKSGDYQKALANYELAMEKGMKSPELYYNAANAAAKLDKTGLAELYYLRAIYMAPRFREATANFAIFAKDNAISVPHEKLLASPISELSEPEWTAATFVFFWLAVGLLVIPPLYAKRHAIWIFLAVLAIAAGIVSMLSMGKWNSFANTAVSLKDDVPLRLSPASHAPIVATANNGQSGKLEKIFGKFGYIKMKNGKSGWANLEEFSPVIYDK